MRSKVVRVSFTFGQNVHCGIPDFQMHTSLAEHVIDSPDQHIDRNRFICTLLTRSRSMKVFDAFIDERV